MYILTAHRIVLLLLRLRLLHDERGVSVTGSQASKIVLLHYAPLDCTFGRSGLIGWSRTPIICKQYAVAPPRD
jgi:hypothetical protein